MRARATFTVVILLQAAPALAQMPNPYAPCAQFTEDRARLACYDAINRKAAPVPVPAAPAPYNPPPPAAEFGGLRAPAPPPPTPRRMTSGVASYTFSPEHRFTVVLDNGQVWRQFLDDTGTAKFSTRKKNTVVITHGFFHSYNLKLNDMNAEFRVQRMK